MPHNIKLKIFDDHVALDMQAEMMAFALAKKLGTNIDDTFIKNFEYDFKRQLPTKYKDATISDMDFSEITEIINKEKAIRERRTKEEKRRLREFRERLKERYGCAYLDDKKVPIANWAVEPPGIFIGRGDHPLRGRWKPQINDHDIVLNLGEDAPVPPGHWKDIVHRPDVLWIAYWDDRLTGQRKYVWLHESSQLLQRRNREKYEKSLKLAKKIDHLRAYINRGMSSRDIRTRKIATVCYLIDTVCMRVGDEKDGDEADTVGATTLRKEHVQLIDHTVKFNFLGKDSVHWEKEIKDPPTIFLDNLKSFMEEDGQLIFQGVSSRHVNGFLSERITGVTAKVFRTYHGTREVLEYLNEVKTPEKLEEYEKQYEIKMANLRAAIKLNHKRTLPKNWEESIEKKRSKLEELKSRVLKTERAIQKHDSVVRKNELMLKFAIMAKEYNLNTSLKNYIDPRAIKGWCDIAQLGLEKVYSASLQKKFSWVKRTNVNWQDFKEILSVE